MVGAGSGGMFCATRIRGEVRFGDGDRALYATDGSNYRQVPIGVVIPRDVEDVTQTILTANRFGAPILSRGGGTSLAGQCCNVAVVMDMSKYFNQLIAIDPAETAGDGAARASCSIEFARRRRSMDSPSGPIRRRIIIARSAG